MGRGFLLFRIKWFYIKKFFIISGSIIGIYTILATAVIITLLAADSRFINSLRNPENVFDGHEIDFGDYLLEDGEYRPRPALPQTPADDDSGLIRPPARTNLLIIGLDGDQILTDALMAACFYRDTGEIRILSIPRDLYTILPELRLEQMRDDGRNPPVYLKINSLRSYGGREHGIQYLIDQLSEMLGINFHYYVEISIPAFKNIVDALGGVTIEIPDVNGGGIYYRDPEQDLVIALDAGVHRLDGDKAEQLVRFRSYNSGDLGRNAVQMEFMKQIFRQVLSRESIMNDPMALATTLLRDVRTNINVDIIRYIPYAGSLSGEKIMSFNMPGVGAYADDGISYFFPDEEKLPEVIREVFYSNQISEAEGDDGLWGTQPSAGLRIQVLNGGRVAGLASSKANELIFAGYNVTDVNSFTGEKNSQTRIYTANGDTGLDLIPFFNNAVIIPTNAMPENFDIMIILGTSEQ